MEKKDDNSRINGPLMATITTLAHESSQDPCIEQRIPDPCTIVIVGASGDLTARKIVPSLFNLFINGDLPTPGVIMGCGRTSLTDHEFRDKMQEACLDSTGMNVSKWERFSECLTISDNSGLKLRQCREYGLQCICE